MSYIDRLNNISPRHRWTEEDKTYDGLCIVIHIPPEGPSHRREYDARNREEARNIELAIEDDWVMARDYRNIGTFTIRPRGKYEKFQPIRNLGAVASLLIAHEAMEHYAHDDVEAFGAPSECHDDVRRGELRRRRKVELAMEKLAHAPMRAILRQLKERGCEPGSKRWQIACALYYAKHFPW